ncbi:hypothetical protein PIB30_013358 [Stylosanthes scabra]|uniref:Uncharacterized protein n=1 Tax=Stylosanthes scabra TaxID=79078 RepID=A0ABU6V8X9_9FABA|nr:hypothetical protein [Stylosanthes scabra]
MGRARPSEDFVVVKENPIFTVADHHHRLHLRSTTFISTSTSELSPILTYHLHRHHQSPSSSQPPSTTAADHHHLLPLRSTTFISTLTFSTVVDPHLSSPLPSSITVFFTITINILRPPSFFVVLQPQSTLQLPSTTNYHSSTKVSQSVNPNHG